MGGEQPGAERGAQRVRERLAAGPPLLLDGATGTELERRGVPTPLPLWGTGALLEQPDRVREIHRDYAAAGAEVLTANTFRTQRRTLARAGLAARAAELTGAAVRLAREGAADAGRGGDVRIAGSDPPLEDCYRPDLVPGDAELAREHAEHVRHLADAGADLILIETINTVREGVAALRAASGLPAFVSFVCGPDARLLSGESLRFALRAVSAFRPLAVLVNCLPPSAVAACLPLLRDTGLPFGVYANLGAPEASGSRRSEDMTPARFADAAAAWADAGARVVGGCCGTTPEHIAALAARLARGSRRNPG